MTMFKHEHGNFCDCVFLHVEIMFVFFSFLHVEFSDQALYLDIKTSAFNIVYIHNI